MKLILTGIFLNVADSIAASLDSVRGVIDEIAFVDTGSTDGTPDVVRAWMRENKVPGTVYMVPWFDYCEARNLPRRKNGDPALFDFSAMRNVAQALACNHATDTKRDFLLEFDGNWKLAGRTQDLRATLEAAPEHCTAFNLDVRQPGSSLKYLRLRRVSECGLGKWMWQWPIHEQIYRSDNATVGDLEGVWIDHDAEPDDRRSWRWERDLLVFDELIDGELARSQPDLNALARFLFYRAQTLECLNRYPEALEAYLARDAVAGPVQDWAVGLFRAGRLAYRLKRSYREVERLWQKSFAVDARPEALWALAELAAERDATQQAQAYANLALQCAARTPMPPAFADPRAWALARFGPAHDNLEVTAREAHLRLLVGA